VGEEEVDERSDAFFKNVDCGEVRAPIARTNFVSAVRPDRCILAENLGRVPIFSIEEVRKT